MRLRNWGCVLVQEYMVWAFWWATWLVATLKNFSWSLFLFSWPFPGQIFDFSWFSWSYNMSNLDKFGLKSTFAPRSGVLTLCVQHAGRRKFLANWIPEPLKQCYTVLVFFLIFLVVYFICPGQCRFSWSFSCFFQIFLIFLVGYEPWWATSNA